MPLLRASCAVRCDKSAKPKQSFGETMKKAGYRALGGGVSGAAAMVIQVGSLMWMRTTMNYQYRYGMTTTDALKTLYNDGGILRFYRGVGPALIQGPASRFGDTFANAGVLELFAQSESMNAWPTPVKTVFASATASSMRAFLVPVDTVKTIMQVEGKEGIPKLMAKYKTGGPVVFFHGAGATLAASFVGHYPWFTVFNTLQANWPKYDDRAQTLCRNAAIGFIASVSSDTVSNSLRVIKTCRQTNETMSYKDIVVKVIEEDGYAGLFGRGLKTRIIANGAQGLMFSVMYKLFEEQWKKRA